MRTWMRWSGAAAATGVLGAVLVMQSCATEGHGKYVRTTPTQGQPASSPGIVNYPANSPAKAARAGEGGVSGGSYMTAGTLSSYRDRDIPMIDLGQALKAAQDGTGGGDGRLSGLWAGHVQDDAAIGFQNRSTVLSLPFTAIAGGQLVRPAPPFLNGAPQAPPEPPRPAVLDLRANQELWVISRYTPAPEPNPPADDSFPGCGSLVCCPPPGEAATTIVPVPLKHTDVHASILGWIATVDVKQQFTNPFSSKIEAVYVFPLPENAAVSEFVMTIGERHIRGIIREREEAQKIYAEAKAQGYTASLLTQERPNIFTQSVANIEPQKSIDIDIRYFHTLSYNDGGFDFTFPMVVGPRFNPPGQTDGVGAVGRNQNGASGQATEVQYLRPSERSGHDISLAVDIDAGVSIESIQSRTHIIDVQRQSGEPGRARVRLASSDTVPNRDFVLRYVVAGDQVKSTLLTQADSKGNGGYFALMVVPPAELKSLRRSPVEFVFVVDRSGSMDGQPIAQAREAVERGLRRLEPGDTFQIIDFAESASQFGAQPVLATPENIQRGLAYAAGLNAQGGTMMLNGLRASLAFPHDPSRLRVIAFLTDGYIGNEAEILKALNDNLGATRVFSFGVGNCNRFLLSEMSRLGRGAVAYLGLQDPAGEVMDLFFDRVSHTALADLKFDWGGAKVSDVYPSRAPDLFVGRPVILTGRYDGAWGGTIRVSGRAGGEVHELVIPAEPTARATGGSSTEGAPASALAAVWARMKIADLGDRQMLDGLADATNEVKRVALEYGLMSAFTAFVAVDSMHKTEGTYGTTVAVPVPVPEGVRYETTVGGVGPRTERR
jgi:Ca-activated chloride channel family protein